MLRCGAVSAVRGGKNPAGYHPCQTSEFGRHRAVGKADRKTLDLPESSAATVDEPVPWEVLS